MSDGAVFRIPILEDLRGDAIFEITGVDVEGDRRCSFILRAPERPHVYHVNRLAYFLAICQRRAADLDKMPFWRTQWFVTPVGPGLAAQWSIDGQWMRIP